MTLTDATRTDIADSLYQSLRTGEPIAPPTDTHDMTIADAYDVQSRVVERRASDGAAVVGHKVGLTSPAIQDQLGVDEPDFGRLLDTMAIDGRTVPMDDLIAPRIEPELGFLLGETLSPPVDHLDVLAATDGVVPAFEIIDSRVRDWDIDIQDTIADNASAGLFATGDAIAPVDDRDLSLEGMKLYRNGDLETTGIGADVLTHPAHAVAWLATTLADLDQQLEAGHLVLSGSFTSALALEPGDSVSVSFSSVGSLTVHAESN